MKREELLWGPDAAGDPDVPYLKQMTFWVIFWSPLDAPGRFVLRRNYVAQNLVTLKVHQFVDREPLLVCCCLSECRKLVPADRVRISRQPEDPPFLLETWI